MNRILIAAALAGSASLASAQAVNVTLSEWKVGLDRDTVPAGSLTFRVKNSGTMTHGFYVRGEGVAKGSKEIPAGQETALTVTLTGPSLASLTSWVAMMSACDRGEGE